MSVENRLWGAPRIHGELLKLGFEVSQSSVAKYMVKRRGSPSQGWRAFLRNHAPDIAAMDLFVVPTISFDLLYAFVIVRLDRRALIWIGVTRHPTAEWIARQITEAFPWNEAPPGYLIRDRDRIFGAIVIPSPVDYFPTGVLGHQWNSVLLRIKSRCSMRARQRSAIAASSSSSVLK